MLPSLNLRGLPYTYSLWDRSVPLPLCDSTVHSGCLPFLPCTPGWAGDRRRCWLGGAHREQWEEDPDFLSLTLKLICYCSAALFILPCAWSKLQWLHFFPRMLMCCSLLTMRSPVLCTDSVWWWGLQEDSKAQNTEVCTALNLEVPRAAECREVWHRGCPASFPNKISVLVIHVIEKKNRGLVNPHQYQMFLVILTWVFLFERYKNIIFEQLIPLGNP